jgi:hypothetical protein
VVVESDVPVEIVDNEVLVVVLVDVVQEVLTLVSG